MNKLLKLAAVSALCLWSSGAMAAGYQLNEFSVTGLGRSFAGAGVVGDDFSALAYNPAGMTLNKTSGVQAGAILAHLNSKVRGEDALGNYAKTKMNYGVPLPHAFAQYRMNDRVTAGFGIYAPYGLKTRYKRNSFVSDAGVISELEIIDIAPALAVKATEKLSIGGSVIVRYIHGKMTNTLNQYGGGFSDFDLDGWTMAWTLGAMYEFTPNTRIGITYKSMSMQTVKGDHKVSDMKAPAYNQTVSDGKASPDLPQSVLISGYHQLNDKWGLSASARWTDFEDSFQEFILSSSANLLQQSSTPGKKVTNESWRKVWTLSAGADYKVNDNWTIRFGTAWDQSPIRNKYHRTIRIPDSDRIWASVGASYTKGNIQIDAGYAHLFMKNSTSQYEGEVAAHFKSYSNIFGLQMQYKF